MWLVLTSTDNRLTPLLRCIAATRGSSNDGTKSYSSVTVSEREWTFPAYLLISHASKLTPKSWTLNRCDPSVSPPRKITEQLNGHHDTFTRRFFLLKTPSHSQKSGCSALVLLGMTSGLLTTLWDFLGDLSIARGWVVAYPLKTCHSISNAHCAWQSQMFVRVRWWDLRVLRWNQKTQSGVYAWVLSLTWGSANTVSSLKSS